MALAPIPPVIPWRPRAMTLLVVPTMLYLVSAIAWRWLVF